MNVSKVNSPRVLLLNVRGKQSKKFKPTDVCCWSEEGWQGIFGHHMPHMLMAQMAQDNDLTRQHRHRPLRDDESCYPSRLGRRGDLSLPLPLRNIITDRESAAQTFADKKKNKKNRQERMSKIGVASPLILLIRYG